jgi:hypothetical protein
MKKIVLMMLLLLVVLASNAQRRRANDDLSGQWGTSREYEKKSSFSIVAEFSQNANNKVSGLLTFAVNSDGTETSYPFYGTLVPGKIYLNCYFKKGGPLYFKAQIYIDDEDRMHWTITTPEEIYPRKFILEFQSTVMSLQGY